MELTLSERIAIRGLVNRELSKRAKMSEGTKRALKESNRTLVSILEKMKS